MGAQTENRKFFADIFTLKRSSPLPFSFNSEYVLDHPPAKRARIMAMPPAPDPPILSNVSETSKSRILRFPAPSPLPRPVHAPQRHSKYSRCVNLDNNYRPPAFEKGKGAAGTENLFRMLREAKMSAFKSLSMFGEGEKLMIFDEYSKKAICEGLSRDMYNRMVEGQEGHSVVSNMSHEVGQSSKATGSPFQPSTSTVSDLSLLTPSKDVVKPLVEYPSPSHVSVGKVNGSPLYKELLQSSRFRDSKLNSIDFEVKLFEKKLYGFKLTTERRAVEAKEDVTRELFVPLTDQEEDEVSHALNGSNRMKIVVTHENSNIDITGEILLCLRPGAWLNDEVINLYLELLKERERRNPKKFLKCHFFNTFFYKKLISGRNGYDYKAIRRWTTQRKIGYNLVDCDKIFVPVHKEIHWCLAVINIGDEKFQYLDSLGGMDTQVLRVLAKYLVDEVKDKSNKEIDVSSWKQEFVNDLPEQQNGWDCGMFMIKYVDFYSRGLSLCFNQEHMPYFRKRTAKEILQLKAD